MVVLVVDDQTHIVNGLINGIDWKKIGVLKTLKAYNSYEAKKIILDNKIDILISDIEMPVESGLDLFRWTKEKGFDIECIFLTSHDDFFYTKDAISLGSFDYILQPARYSVVEDSVVNVIRKIREKCKDKKYYEYGKLLYEEKESVTSWFLNDWFRGDNIDDLEGKLHGFNIYIKIDSAVYFVILDIIKANGYKTDQLLHIITETTSSIFKNYGQNILITKLENGDYAFLVYPNENFEIDMPAVIRQLKLIISTLDNGSGIIAACYTSDKTRICDIAEQASSVRQLKNKNVAKLRKVFCVSDKKNYINNIKKNINMKMIEEMLFNGNSQSVILETDRFFEKMRENQQLNEIILKMFYQAYTQILSKLMERNGMTLNDMFSNEAELELAFSSYNSVEHMKKFIYFSSKYFRDNSEVKLEEKKINKIINYIRTNIDSNITREEVAKAVYLNPNYLSRYFKNETGLTFKEFVINEKMRIARNLIKTTQLPVGVIAAKVGYTNFSYFSHLYKQVFDITPSQQRKS